MSETAEIRTVTMLFTDIEGSTALLHRLGPSWPDALTTHRRIIRAAVTAWSGEEMGTEGDSFFVVFPDARGAVRASVDAQRALQAQSWPADVALRVRMGLHTGTPQRLGDGFVGEDVHLAARIGATAHGGQVVVSTQTRALAGALPDITLRDLGRHRLKDFSGDHELFQVVAPELLDDFPPLRSLGRRAALPRPTTPLVGRDTELRDLEARYASGPVPLLTLTGPGGCGKTRLALALAAAVTERFDDGVFFVPLEAVREVDVMAYAVGDALGLPPGATLTERLAASTERRWLVVLDNLEQIAGADAVVRDLLAGAPGVRVLCTSRRPLLMAGEQEYPVSPLALPQSGTDSSPAVDLYVRSVQLARPSFRLTEQNRPDVALLVRRLDGLPLGIELAAASARLLGPAALLSRLDSGLGAGVTAGDRPERHRSLGATVAWSHELLDPPARELFRRLSVFAGPVDLDRIAEVAAGSGGDVLDLVRGLLDTSLVQVVDGADGEPRVAMLETVKRYAAERLVESGEEAVARDRHLHAYLAAVASLVPLLRGPRHPVTLDALGVLDPEVRGALDWSLRPATDDAGRARVRTGIDLLDAVTTYWYRFGSTVETRRWHVRALDVAEEVDSEPNLTLLNSLAVLMMQHGDTRDALPVIERELRAAERLGRPDLQARALNLMGIAHFQLSEITLARSCYERSAVLARAAGTARIEAMATGNLVPVLTDEGEFAAAVDAGWRAVSTTQGLGDAWMLAIDRLSLVTAILFGEGPEAARTRLLEWAPEVLSLRDTHLDVGLVELGAGIVAAEGNADSAARLVGCADGLRASLPMARTAQDDGLLARYLRPLGDQTQTVAFAAVRSAHTGLSSADAVTLLAAGTATPG